MMNKNLSVVLLFLAIALLVFATSAFALTNEDVSLDEEGFDVLGGSSSGNFLMSTDNGEAIFWGTYNGTSQTLSGTVLWMSNAIIRVGTGAYSPTSSNSGSISLPPHPNIKRIYSSVFCKFRSPLGNKHCSCRVCLKTTMLSNHTTTDSSNCAS